MDRRDCIRWGGAALVASLSPGMRALAQSKYPASTIRLVVPYAPGGVVDAVARNLDALKMKAPLGTVIHPWKSLTGGGGGVIGANAVAHARLDGYTLLFGDTSCQIIAPYLMLHPPYDAAKDFAAVSMIATSSTAIVVHPGVPARTLGEFIEYARNNQKKLSYASAGAGTVTHLAGELFKQLSKTPDILHVPYRGAGPGLIDLIAGVVPMMTPNVTSQVLNFHKTGDLRILAVCAPARLKAAPEIPAAVETLPGLVAGLTCGVLAPAGTPQPIIAQISDVTAGIITQPDFDVALQAAGYRRRERTRARRRPKRTSRRGSVSAHLIPIIEAAGLQRQ